MAQLPKPVVGYHLDLKYQMPKKTWLLDWVKRLPGFGINTLLIEYEDKFPFEKYPFLRAKDAFTPEELKEFLAAARAAGLAVIPLIQTLSHLEFALEHEELAELREMPDIPTQICPSNPKAVEFVKDLLRDALPYHKEDEVFHLGADETWFLGSCPKCAEWVKDDPIPVWKEHISGMCKFIMEAGKRPIVWDDIFRSEPERAEGLPKEIILNCWEYGQTEIDNSRFPWRNADVFQKLGYDLVASPCLNWGIFMPNNSRVWNTAAWARKLIDCEMPGMLNTAWACFHVPIPTTAMQIAATGELMRDNTAVLEKEWQEKFMAEEFGARVEGLIDALDDLGEGGSFKVEGLGRALSIGPYGYTDMVLHYKGAQAERRKRGAYPLDWNEIDFVRMYHRKISYLRAAPADDPVFDKLTDLIEIYGKARKPINKLAEAATKQKEEARLFSLFADMKWRHSRVMHHLVKNKGDRSQLIDEMAAERKDLAEALKPFLEPPSVDRMIRLWSGAIHDYLTSELADKKTAPDDAAWTAGDSSVKDKEEQF